ncbi:tetratricopeptide repeat protein [Sphingobacterium pedocola]|uniref:Tetratricopeptide repeat protein n=1 Tax=Sphingobacterium pedocola TaxID=2082722 RepID=A0ABR9T1M4_9SPHI|nr:tetratricopeptide repeat protein [Sphingobacterium pedocola]MBE8719238.1 tetratricopeptide repeat protein [Sphingobacterium pedocola]
MDRLTQLLSFVAESPQDPFLKYALTMEYLKAEDMEKVEKGFKDLVENFPDYVGTYYHYGKFLEKENNKEEALKIYQLGMHVARKVRNTHALGELQNAYNLATGFDDDDD